MNAPRQRSSLYCSTYVSALHEYLREPSEDSLTVAYELGRAAVIQQLSVLDVAVAYHQGLTDALSGASAQAGWASISHHAGDFFLESLASFEMLHRGAAEARSSISEHRHRAQLSRQLSTFLADSSLALRSSESLDEVLQLAVDQGREILGAGCCLATVTGVGEPRASEAVSQAAPDADWAFVRWLDLPRLYRLLEENHGLLRLVREREGPSVMLQPDRSPCQWLAVPLTALDGTQIGALQAFAPAADAFDGEAGAALIHLAQTVSATVERMRLYGQATSARG
jgi:hypothetical protein